MGGGTWRSEVYAARTTSHIDKTREQVFTRREIRHDFNPNHIDMRESRDSEDQPESTAVIVGLDVTGSMGMIAENIAKGGLGRLVESMLEHTPVPDPHMMFMAIGDNVSRDQAPLQVTQFEADIRIAEQLEDLWLEGCGGGNNFESYDLPWRFAAQKTSIDCFEKRGKRGYLFTMGDELPPRESGNLSKVGLERFGQGGSDDIQTALEITREKYHVFHLVIEQGSYIRRRGKDDVMNAWCALMGRRAIPVRNYEHIPEIIVSTILINEGNDPNDVLQMWQSEEVRKTLAYAFTVNTQE